MTRLTRRGLVRTTGLSVLAGLAGCSSGSTSSDADNATDDGGAGEMTTTSKGASSPREAVDALLRNQNDGNLDAIRQYSVGFENLGPWSTDATIYLPGDGNTLATQLIQGDATAEHAYGNFAPDGKYLEVDSVDIGESRTPTGKIGEEQQDTPLERLNEMNGPAVEKVQVTEPTLDYRINLEGTWYDTQTTTKAYSAKIDGRWYVMTGVTPWYVVIDLMTGAKFGTAAQIAQIRRTVTLPLGPQ